MQRPTLSCGRKWQRKIFMCVEDEKVGNSATVLQLSTLFNLGHLGAAKRIRPLGGERIYLDSRKGLGWLCIQLGRGCQEILWLLVSFLFWATLCTCSRLLLIHGRHRRCVFSLFLPHNLDKDYLWCAGGSESYSDLRRIRGGGQESRKAGGEPKKASPTGQEQVAGQGGVPPYSWPSGPGG